MVIYDLQCVNHHQFEGWFKNADDLANQQASSLLVCPVCDSMDVSKRLTAAKVGKKSNATLDRAQTVVATKGNRDSDAKVYRQAQKMLGEMHDYIDKNFVDVGNRFASEARMIHRGEKDAANIRGVASKDEVKALAEEGVSVLPIPPKPIDKKKLN